MANNMYSDGGYNMYSVYYIYPPLLVICTKGVCKVVLIKCSGSGSGMSGNA